MRSWQLRVERLLEPVRPARELLSALELRDLLRPPMKQIGGILIDGKTESELVQSRKKKKSR